MKRYILQKPIDGLNYNPGDTISLYTDRFGKLLYHVWRTMVTVPNESVKPYTG